MPVTPPSRSNALANWRLAWIASVIAAVAYSIFLRAQGAPLMQWLEHGIVTLELPGTPERAMQLVDALGERGRAIAILQVQLDFIFLLLYPLAFSISTALLATHVGPTLGRVCSVMSRVIWLAAPLDAIENVSMLRMLAGHTDTPWPQVSTVCATLKFALVIAAALLLIVGLARWGWLRLRGRPD